MAVILPPKIYFYEPKIYGFKIAGKRGSAFFKPTTGNVKVVEESLQGLELEAYKKQAATKAQMSVLPQAFERQLKIEEIPD